MDNAHLIEAKKALDEAQTKVDAAAKEGRELSAEEAAFVDAAFEAVESAEAKAKNEERSAKLAEVQAQFARQLEANEEAVKEASKGILRPSGEADKGDTEPTCGVAYVKAFNAWARGDNSPEVVNLLAKESKAAGAEGSDTTGGFLVPTGLYQTLWVDASEGYPLLDYVTSINISGFKLNLDRDFTAASMTEVTEAGTPSASDLTYGQVTIQAYKGQRINKVSDELLADASFDVASHMAGKLARASAEWQNLRLTTGSGSSQGQGVMTYCGTATSQYVTGVTGSQSTSWAPDDVYSVLHKCKPQYRNGATWMFSDDTARITRVMRDAEGVPLWQQSMQLGLPSTLAGYPVLLNGDVADMAASAISVFFGDLKSEVRIVPNGGNYELLRLNELYAATGQVGFRATQRFGCAWVGPDASGAAFVNSAS